MKKVMLITLALALFLVPSAEASFYQPNKKDLGGKKGKLIRSKKAPKSVTLANARDSRTVLYTSRSVSGKKIAASGTVMLPKGRAPKGGWPVILFHHGTTGMADICAPSKGSSLIASYADISLLYNTWLEKGYALALPDYQGLGTPGPHPYLIGKSQAQSSLDILPAAKKLFPRLSRKYSIMGHSQGGQAAIFSAAIAKKYAKGFQNMGTISYAPPSSFDLQAKLLGTLGNEPSSLTALATLIVLSAAREAGVDPKSALNPRIFDKKDSVLSAGGYSLWENSERVCLPQNSARTSASGGLAPSQFLTAFDWIGDPVLSKIEVVLKKMEPALKVEKPLVVLQGEADTTVLPDLTKGLSTKLANLNGSRFSYKTYPGVDHSSILVDSESDVLAYLSSFFAR